jgi:hypothetical protein
VLADVIGSGAIPIVRLTEVFRLWRSPSRERGHDGDGRNCGNGSACLDLVAFSLSPNALLYTMTKVGKLDWEETFAGTQGNDADAPRKPQGPLTESWAYMA